MLVSLCGAMSYAIAMLSLRRLSTRESTESIAFQVSVVAGVVLALFGSWQLVWPTRTALPLLGLSALSGGFASSR